MSAAPVVVELREAHERLATIVDSLTLDQVKGPSCCDEWTVAQVLSHLGSSAEIGLLRLDAFAGDDAVPGAEQFHPIWDDWNARPADEQARTGVEANARYVAEVEQLTPEQLALPVDLFGLDLDVTGLLRMRLFEVVVHTWDVEVISDPAATVPPGAVAELLELFPASARRLGRPDGVVRRVELRTTDPDGSYLLETADEITLTPAPRSSDARTLTGEALLRLLYGRLEHPLFADLRPLFPGP